MTTTPGPATRAAQAQSMLDTIDRLFTATGEGRLALVQLASAATQDVDDLLETELEADAMPATKLAVIVEMLAALVAACPEQENFRDKVRDLTMRALPVRIAEKSLVIDAQVAMEKEYGMGARPS